MKPLAKVPLKPVKLQNAITGADKYVQPPDIVIEPVSGYEMNYFKSLSKAQNPFGKRNSEFGRINEVKKFRQVLGRQDQDTSKLLMSSLDN